jgi:peptide/nickel transport system permease protein
MIAIGISATPIFIRLTRAQVISAKAEDYVEAARALGNRTCASRCATSSPNIVAPLSCRPRLPSLRP